MKKLIIILLVLVGLFILISPPGQLSKRSKSSSSVSNEVKVVDEESATIAAIDKSIPSVVTISIDKTTTVPSSFEIDPFNPFSPFKQVPGKEQKIEQNIGSGFIVSADGLIITNKHVVSDTEATYKVLTNNHKTYTVEHISRDPLNDLAILKINTNNLIPIQLGDSSHLKLGQHVIAIGTPLGQFTNTVTSGIISGLGRGIDAGSPFEQFVERLDNVIQTDAAINPGNSGGALINLTGEAIGVNTAVSAQGQNIGFAIPINVVKDLLANFNKAGGTIERPFLGIRYQMITRENALTNEVPEGARVIEIISGSPAQNADLQPEDIIVEFEGQKIKAEYDKTIQKRLAAHKIGDRLSVKIWRDGKTIDKTITLEITE
ncbi:hypothetical protein A3D80_04250 [Candidatus Roizmanbacteria bacterium RIFCSPHIGHO2_02_FULL_40_13b]|uniref:PDZ domain-containing protein n=1 Tax=Candidatus Roizmanbacteria bacterium RIFCSPHIGHO2_01_FULL_39_24 TaxID=1802032 RepID=A0A1F7GE60_9BACT|nr:MAG: hypothetical protein A2799_03460 [Candidatus Roizmanbacteria bacterium RIFCSPHIGHO2_01_FULL_39_24]OGK27722.1 MAG: hypothetical protein A3D80_04250 [Candidatus Roizmanbacteria bacterium RIFCSPHIGHO2_02_FULL_40_13b]OGK49486.1 MAG: hypothetical protein A3A56_01940 [Candidatus Roizmanbacteria bacterium RIFCSPLOWO2_01_FULL_40_32]OGK56671.1 MAG: hypothetical protein A3H83_01410 [Candidatus Roizmanbacteria bacterium RIFCSPLOWO2_02_FULL_39_8]